MQKSTNNTNPPVTMLARDNRETAKQYYKLLEQKTAKQTKEDITTLISWQTSFIKENPIIIQSLHDYCRQPPLGLTEIFSSRTIYLGAEWFENTQEITIIKKHIYEFMDIIYGIIHAQGQQQHIPHEAQHLVTTTEYFKIQERKRHTKTGP
jgi:hypothetical protein